MSETLFYLCVPVWLHIKNLVRRTEIINLNGLFPKEQITYLKNADEYSGKGIALEATKRILYIPDEELLQIIHS